MLPAIISPELSRQLSVKGQNHKKALGNTHIFDVLAGKRFAKLYNCHFGNFCGYQRFR